MRFKIAFSAMLAVAIPAPALSQALFFTHCFVVMMNRDQIAVPRAFDQATCIAKGKACANGQPWRAINFMSGGINISSDNNNGHLIICNN